MRLIANLNCCAADSDFRWLLKCSKGLVTQVLLISKVVDQVQNAFNRRIGNRKLLLRTLALSRNRTNILQNTAISSKILYCYSVRTNLNCRTIRTRCTNKFHGGSDFGGIQKKIKVNHTKTKYLLLSCSNLLHRCWYKWIEREKKIKIWRGILIFNRGLFLSVVIRLSSVITYFSLMSAHNHRCI